MSNSIHKSSSSYVWQRERELCRVYTALNHESIHLMAHWKRAREQEQHRKIDERLGNYFTRERERVARTTTLRDMRCKKGWGGEAG